MRHLIIALLLSLTTTSAAATHPTKPLDVTVGYDPADPVTVLVKDRRPRFMDARKPDAFTGARIGVFAPYHCDTDAEIADSVRTAIGTMKSLGATVIEVPMTAFDTLMVNTSVTNQETKHDLAAYFATVPNAPVKSLREILARGQFDKELEVRFRSFDTVPDLENDAHSLTLSRQAALRARVEHVLDSLQLDAIAYPTVRQAPVFPGQVQAGSTCQLGAESGLPSIAFPAGFTADGLPVSVELLGKAMSDVKLVSFAYDFEQNGSRRRPPRTTPALVSGTAPAPRVVARTLTSGAANVAARIIIDVVGNEMRWTVWNVGAPSAVSAVVLRRVGGGTITGVAASTTGRAPPVGTITVPDDAVRVVARLMGPAGRTASGSLPLSARDRDAFGKGLLSVAQYTAGGTTVETVLK